MKRLVLLFITVFAGTLWAGNSHTGYRFVLTIEGNQDSVMYLGNYYAGNTYATDTAFRNKKGQFIFDRPDRTLLPGLYFFTNPSGNYVEFIVYHETPRFTFETKEQGWSRFMKMKGSTENEIFFYYQQCNRDAYYRIDSAQKSGMEGEALSNFKRQTMRQLDSLKEQIITAHPHSMLSMMMNSTREVAVPTTGSDNQPLSDKERYYYFVEHYFDHMQLDDDALVRTPDAIFHKPLMDYLDTYLKGASAKRICGYADSLIARSEGAPEVFKYLVHTITEKYLQSNVMSYDEVYVHMVKTYYATGRAVWSSPSVVDEQVKRANTMERLLIGKPHPELVMKDIDGRVFSSYGLTGRYTLLLFWSPTCGHCKTMIPELYEKFKLYQEKYNIEAYAVLSEPDDHTIPMWKEFIAKNGMTDAHWHNMNGAEANVDWHEVYNIVTTPQIYLIDKEHKILAKKLNADSFESIIRILEGEE